MCVCVYRTHNRENLLSSVFASPIKQNPTHSEREMNDLSTKPRQARDKTNACAYIKCSQIRNNPTTPIKQSMLT